MHWSDTVERASLANLQITSDCGAQHWTVSGTNLNAVRSWKKCTSIKDSKLLTIKLNTSSIWYFLRCQWLLGLTRYSTEFYELKVHFKEVMRMSLNALPKHEYLKFFLFPLSVFQTSWLLYTIVHWVSVSSCIRIRVLGLNDTYWQYIIYFMEAISCENYT